MQCLFLCGLFHFFLDYFPFHLKFSCLPPLLLFLFLSYTIFQVSVSSTAVFRNRVLWNAAYGILDKSVQPGISPDENTLYRTGSLVKLLTVSFKTIGSA